MRNLVLILSGVAAALIIAMGVVGAVILLAGDGVDEEAYRREVRPLIVAWQSNFGLSTFECEAEDQEESLTEEDVQFLAGAVAALSDIHRDVRALETPKRYRPGVEAMGAVAAELETLDEDFDALVRAAREIQRFDPEEALANVPPTPENVSWFVRASGAFETWGIDFEKWSRFIDCTLPEEPERVGELGGYIGQLEIDQEELNRLQREGPRGVVAAFGPIFDGAEISTQTFVKLSRALEHQVELERVFADVIEAP